MDISFRKRSFRDLSYTWKWDSVPLISDYCVYALIHHIIFLLFVYAVSEGVVAESLTKLMDNKLVKDKKMELEKKIDALRRKQEKERYRAQHMKSSHESDRMRMSKFSMSSRFVKRLSIKNM